MRGVGANSLSDFESIKDFVKAIRLDKSWIDNINHTRDPFSIPHLPYLLEIHVDIGTSIVTTG